jgi:hypothetical protein
MWLSEPYPLTENQSAVSLEPKTCAQVSDAPAAMASPGSEGV